MSPKTLQIIEVPIHAILETKMRSELGRCQVLIQYKTDKLNLDC